MSEPACNIDIYDLLLEIRDRPQLYGIETVHELECFLQGVYFACDRLGRSTEECPPFRHFRDWLGRHLGQPYLSVGWCNLIETHCGDGQPALQECFRLIREFRKRTPNTIATTDRKPSHVATGSSRWEIGTGDDWTDMTWEVPNRARIVQYTGDSGVYLEYHYADDHFRESYCSDVQEAKTEAERDFKIRNDDWV